MLSFCLYLFTGHSTARAETPLTARQISLSGAQSAGTDDTFAARSNPASLTHQDRAAFSLQLTQQSYDLEGVVPREDTQSWQPSSGLAADQRRASEFQNQTTSHLGLNLPILRNVNFGLAASLPNDRLASVYAHTRQDPQYLQYSDRLVRPQVYTALAARLPLGLSLGGGLYYSLRADGKLQVGLNGEEMESRLQLDLKPEYVPYGSLQWSSQRESAPQYFADLYYRAAQTAPSQLDVDVNIGIDEASLPLSIGAELIPYFDPEIIRSSFAFEGETRRLYASAQQTRWSQYRSPIVRYSGPDVPRGNAASAPSSELGLVDAMTYNLGTEQAFNTGASLQHAARLGVSYEESAVDKSPPDTVLLVDTDKFSVGLGYGLLIQDLQIAPYPIQLDLGLRHTWLEHRSLTDARGRRVNAGGNLSTAAAGVSYVF